MVQQVDPEKIILKTKQYEFADGLQDIQMGVMLILMGATWNWVIFEPSWLRLIIQLRDDYGKWAITVVFILVLFFSIAGILGMQRMMENIRRRWLWRESGMVKSSWILVPRRILVLSAVVFIGTVALGFKLQSTLKTGEWFGLSLLLLATGWGFGITLIGLGNHLKIPRYVYMGLIGGLASTAILLYQTSFTDASMVFYMGWGFLLLISGAIVLRRAWPKAGEKNHAG